MRIVRFVRVLDGYTLGQADSRSLHDLGLATWFGGSLMGAVGLNGAAAQVEEPKQRLRVANSGWNRWTPVNLAGIAAHPGGGAVLLGANKGARHVPRRQPDQ